MRFISSASHCAAASPFLVPGPRPSKASSDMALSRAARSAALMSGVVLGWPGYSAEETPADRASAKDVKEISLLIIAERLRACEGPKSITASARLNRDTIRG